MTEHSALCSMFGMFNLRGGIDLPAFKTDYDALCEHLNLEGYLISWRMWERAYHHGYDAGYPEVAVMIEMCFHDHAASLACWDYVEANEEPLKTLHMAVNSKVENSMFVLHREVT
jgi:hypothetical protein